MKIISAVFMFLVVSTYGFAAPLGLSVNKKHEDVPRVSGFKYWYGDISSYGKVIYLGVEDLAGFETELHLDFKNKKITTATLILGPAGIDDQNCILKYKKVISVLNKKYGKYQHQIVEKDPIMDDLLAVSTCHPVQVGLYSSTTYWRMKNFGIIVTLIGEDGEFFIEIEYRFRAKVNLETKKLIKAL